MAKLVSMYKLLHISERLEPGSISACGKLEVCFAEDRGGAQKSMFGYLLGPNVAKQTAAYQEWALPPAVRSRPDSFLTSPELLFMHYWERTNLLGEAQDISSFGASAAVLVLGGKRGTVYVYGSLSRDVLIKDQCMLFGTHYSHL